MPNLCSALTLTYCLQWGLCSAFLWLHSSPSSYWWCGPWELVNWDSWPHYIPSCLHRNLACGKGLSSTRAFPEVRTTGSNFTAFQIFFFVVFITSLKDPCSLFGLTEPKPAWNLWRDSFWLSCLSRGAGIHSGTCLKAATELFLGQRSIRNLTFYRH